MNINNLIKQYEEKRDDHTFSEFDSGQAQGYSETVNDLITLQTEMREWIKENSEEITIGGEIYITGDVLCKQPLINAFGLDNE